MPIICLATLSTIYPLPLEPSLDDFEQGLVCDLNFSVGLKVGGGGVVILDPQL